MGTSATTKTVALVVFLSLILGLLFFILGFQCGSTKRQRRMNEIRLDDVYSMSPDTLFNIRIVRQCPRIAVIDSFLTESECKQVIKQAEGRFKRSRVSSDERIISPARTSQTAHLKKGETPLVLAIEKRASLLSGCLPTSHIEPLQVVKYDPGGFYKPHFDYFPKNRRTIKACGQRLLTLFVYLNDLAPDDTGGHTAFPKLGIQFKPKQGSAVMFWNTDLDGKVDPTTLHGGNPPIKSSKFGMNIWIRRHPWRH